MLARPALNSRRSICLWIAVVKIVHQYTQPQTFWSLKYISIAMCRSSHPQSLPGGKKPAGVSGAVLHCWLHRHCMGVCTNRIYFTFPQSVCGDRGSERFYALCYVMSSLPAVLHPCAVLPAGQSQLHVSLAHTALWWVQAPGWLAVLDACLWLANIKSLGVWYMRLTWCWHLPFPKLLLRLASHIQEVTSVCDRDDRMYLVVFLGPVLYLRFFWAWVCFGFFDTLGIKLRDLHMLSKCSTIVNHLSHFPHFEEPHRPG